MCVFYFLLTHTHSLSLPIMQAVAVIVRRAHQQGVLVYLTNVCPSVKSALLHTELIHHGMFASTIQDAVGVA